jgi:LacI family transcriptional regulator
MAESAIDILVRSIRQRGGEVRKIVDHVLVHELVQRDSVARIADSAR